MSEGYSFLFVSSLIPCREGREHPPRACEGHAEGAVAHFCCLKPLSSRRAWLGCGKLGKLLGMEPTGGLEPGRKLVVGGDGAGDERLGW